MSLEQLITILEDANLAAYILLAVVSTWQWSRRRTEPGKWLALTFLALAFVTVLGRILPEQPQGAGAELLVKIDISMLLLFPYFLYRFAAAFEKPGRRTEIIAAGLTGGIIIWTFL